MPNKTGISWCDETWNPFVGCSPVSPACAHCYAQEQAARIVRLARGVGRVSHYEAALSQAGGAPRWSGAIAQAPEKSRLAMLAKTRKPSDVFVGSMTDFFHPAAPEDWRIEALAIMALTPWRRYLLLTKRAPDMRALMSNPNTPRRIAAIILTRHLDWGVSGHDAIAALAPRAQERDKESVRWPLENVALGVTAEDQERADLRIPELLATPAAWRFLSCAPLLGPLDLFGLDYEGPLLGGEPTQQQISGPNGVWFIRHGGPRLDFIVVEGESGKTARPTHPDWVRGLRDQCAQTETTFHFKQWGEWADVNQPENGAVVMESRERHFWPDKTGQMMRVGTRRAGHLLDGVEHRGRLPARTAP